MTVEDLDVPFDAGAPRLRVDYVAGFFAEALRRSPYGQQIRVEDLAVIAHDVAEQTEDEQVAELAHLIELSND